MNENSSEQNHSFEQDDSSEYDHSSEYDQSSDHHDSYAQDRPFKPDHTGGKTLNWILGIITALVAGGIAWVGWNFIDSVQKHTGELKNYHVTADNAKIDSHRYDTINKDVDEHIFNNQTDPEQALQEAVFKLKGSEISFSKGLTALDNNNYAIAEVNFSNVLANIPLEAKQKTTWRAFGNVADRNFFTVAALQRRALCYIKTDKYDKAVIDLTEAIKLRPTLAVNYENRATAYNKLGKKALAAADLNKARALSKSN
jgi:tetratricopeptide (TPR) repeat protein